jgi:hypothetical protein
METSNGSNDNLVIRESVKSCLILLTLSGIYFLFALGSLIVGINQLFSLNFTSYGFASPSSPFLRLFDLIVVFVTFAIGPLAIIIFIVRGFRLYRKGNIKLVAISIVLPLLVYLGVFSAIQSHYTYSRAFNIFSPYISIATRKIELNNSVKEYEKLAAGTEVNPTIICATRDKGRAVGASPVNRTWVYDWGIEWEGLIKFPQVTISNFHTYIFATIGNTNVQNSILSGGSTYTERANSEFQNIYFESGLDNNVFQSDGKFHTWKMVYSADPLIDFDLFNRNFTPASPPDTPPYVPAPKGAGYKIDFYFANERTGIFGKSYYTLIVPEEVTQKLLNLVRTDESYTRELTESERVAGTVCATLKQ